jgi:hypothetical protein
MKTKSNTELRALPRGANRSKRRNVVRQYELTREQVNNRTHSYLTRLFAEMAKELEASPDKTNDAVTRIVNAANARYLAWRNNFVKSGASAIPARDAFMNEVYKADGEARAEAEAAEPYPLPAPALDSFSAGVAEYKAALYSDFVRLFNRFTAWFTRLVGKRRKDGMITAMEVVIDFLTCPVEVVMMITIFNKWFAGRRYPLLFWVPVCAILYVPALIVVLITLAAYAADRNDDKNNGSGAPEQ